jgi:hypothetical protein
MSGYNLVTCTLKATTAKIFKRRRGSLVLFPCYNFSLFLDIPPSYSKNEISSNPLKG